jgi:hypothetical protein
MRHTAVLSVALLFGSTFAFPQDSTQPVIVYTSPGMMSLHCPVQMTAQKLGGLAMREASDRRSYEATQELQLFWKNFRTKNVVAATIVVSGHDASPRLLPTGQRVTPELIRAFDVKMDLSHGNTTETRLSARSFATVSRIDLKSVEYADGTHWAISPGETCSVEPNGFMLVGATAH